MTAAARARALTFVVPGSIDMLTGGYGYDRRIVGGLRGLGWDVRVVELEGAYPFPSPEARRHAARALAAIDDGALVLIDGLALGALPDEVARESRRLRMAALVHHPLADETGLDAGAAAALAQQETRALRAVRLITVTSGPTAAGLARYGVDPTSVVVIEPGTDRAAQSRGSGEGGVELLCVATLVPRKGHDVLLSALAAPAMAGLRWHLTCVGSPDRDDAWAARLQDQARRQRLAGQVTFAGERGAAELDACYDRADLFVLPTWYEGYGMAVAEALARGLPVVSTPTGAIADLVGSDAGVLVPAGDVAALAAALSTVVGRADARARLAAGARRVRDRLPTWEDAARRMAEALDGIDG